MVVSGKCTSHRFTFRVLQTEGADSAYWSDKLSLSTVCVLSFLLEHLFLSFFKAFYLITKVLKGETKEWMVCIDWFLFFELYIPLNLSFA